MRGGRHLRTRLHTTHMQPVLAPQGDRTHRVLRKIVRQLDLGILETSLELLPLVQRVVHRLAQCTPRQRLRSKRQAPQMTCSMNELSSGDLRVSIISVCGFSMRGSGRNNAVLTSPKAVTLSPMPSAEGHGGQCEAGRATQDADRIVQVLPEAVEPAEAPGVVRFLANLQRRSECGRRCHHRAMGGHLFF